MAVAHTATANTNPAPAATTAPAGIVSGKISYEDTGTGALGTNYPIASTPGIAVWNTATLGGWWMIVMPNGTVTVIQQIDTGPNPNTGRKFDFTSAALPGLGYSTDNFPTDDTVQGVYIGTTISDSGEGHAVAGSVSGVTAIAMLGIGTAQAGPLEMTLSNNNIGQGIAVDITGNVTDLGTGTTSAQSLNATGPLAFLQGDTPNGNPITVPSITSGLTSLLGDLVSRSTWIMILKILCGIILVGVGLYLLVKGT